jgi:hypothetical protein
VDECREQGIVLDDDAARLIVRRCRSQDPAATDEEVAFFTRAKILQLRGRRNIGNMVGLLITAVPAYFAGARTEVVRYRRVKAAEHRQAEAVAREVLSDPNASEQEKLWARSQLAA